MSDGIHIEVERTQPVADTTGTRLMRLVANWIAAKASASLDPNDNNPMLTDRVAAIDVLALAIALTDLSSARDALLAHVRKSLADTVAVADAIRVDINKAAHDITGALDHLTLGVARQDAAALLDSVLAHVQKQFNDASGDADRLLMNLARPLQDADGASDAGTAYIQTYASNYFSNEYVGEKFTF